VNTWEPRGRSHRTAELGALVLTALPKKSMSGRRWRDSRLELFADGLAVTAPTEPPRLYRYATTSVLQYLVKVNGSLQEAAYTLIDTDGRGRTIGSGNHGTLGRTLQRLGAREVVRGSVFTEVENAGDSEPGRQRPVPRRRGPDPGRRAAGLRRHLLRRHQRHGPAPHRRVGLDRAGVGRRRHGLVRRPA
jgi:hypothetical protein